MRVGAATATNSARPGGLAVDAVLVIDKPVGPTSFDVVRKVRRAAGVRRVGHGGTLDPAASGVLPICLGEATKLAQFLLDADKEYDFTVCFGVETDTDDAAGAITARADASAIDEAAVRDALAAFRGAITQVPPHYSALKRDGRALYDYARAGEPVEAAPRAVVVHELTLTAFGGPEAAAFSMRCSKGTYVRALARDLGRALGVGAHVTALRRTRSGPFSLAEAHPLDAALAALAAGDRAGLALVELADALRHLPRQVVTDDFARDVRLGRRVNLGTLEGFPTPPAMSSGGQSPPTLDATALEPGDGKGDQRLCLLDGGGKLVAVAQRREGGALEMLRVFGV